MNKPSTPELREFYLCGIRTGYLTSKAAAVAAQRWDSHTVYDCEYCPGVHHVKALALSDETAMVDLASGHWDALLKTLTRN